MLPKCRTGTGDLTNKRMKANENNGCKFVTEKLGEKLGQKPDKYDYVIISCLPVKTEVTIKIILIHAGFELADLLFLIV